MEKRRKAEETGGAWVGGMCQLLKGGGAAAGTALLGLAGCALLVSAGVMGEGAMDRGVLAVCVAGGLVGGVAACRGLRRCALPAGIGVGGILFLLLLSAGLLLFPEASVSNGGPAILLSCCCGGAMAGILCRRPKKKRKR